MLFAEGGEYHLVRQMVKIIKMGGTGLTRFAQSMDITLNIKQDVINGFGNNYITIQG